MTGSRLCPRTYSALIPSSVRTHAFESVRSTQGCGRSPAPPISIMRRKLRGYVFQFTRSDHGGRHIHVYRNDQELGVFDLFDGAIRGLEHEMNAQLREGLSEFIRELNERGFFRR
jgi:hypothetical protein